MVRLLMFPLWLMDKIAHCVISILGLRNYKTTVILEEIPKSEVPEHIREQLK